MEGGEQWQRCGGEDLGARERTSDESFDLDISIVVTMKNRVILQNEGYNFEISSGNGSSMAFFHQRA